MSTEETIEGQVTHINHDRGFAFAMTSALRDAVFVHCSRFEPGVFDSLRKGDRIMLTLGQDKSGRPCAATARMVEARQGVVLPIVKAPKGYV